MVSILFFPRRFFGFVKRFGLKTVFSATSASYFRRLSWVTLIYLICPFFTRFSAFFAVFDRLYRPQKPCNSHFVSIVYLLPVASGNRDFPETPFSHICFRSFCTNFGANFLHPKKLHKNSEACRTEDVLPPFTPVTPVISGMKWYFRPHSSISVTDATGKSVLPSQHRHRPVKRRVCATISSPARSTSAAVLPLPNERRSMVRARDGGYPMASRTADGSVLPL